MHHVGIEDEHDLGSEWPRIKVEDIWQIVVFFHTLEIRLRSCVWRLACEHWRHGQDVTEKVTVRRPRKPSHTSPFGVELQYETDDQGGDAQANGPAQGGGGGEEVHHREAASSRVHKRR